MHGRRVKPALPWRLHAAAARCVAVAAHVAQHLSVGAPGGVGGEGDAERDRRVEPLAAWDGEGRREEHERGGGLSPRGAGGDEL